MVNVVKFNDDGQGFFDFIIDNCSDDFISRVKNEINNENFIKTEFLFADKKGNVTEAVFTHDDGYWFTVLTEVKSVINDDIIRYDNLVSRDNIDIIIKYLAGDKND